MNDMLDARRLVADALNRPLDSITETGAVDATSGWDSIGHVSIILALEARIGRLLRPDEVGSLRSLADVAAILSHE